MSKSNNVPQDDFEEQMRSSEEAGKAKPNGADSLHEKSSQSVDGSGAVGDDSIDNLNLADFRIDQDFATQLKIRRRPVSVVVDHPHNQAWVSFHPTWRMSITALVDKTNRQIYFVHPKLAPDLTRDLTPKLLVPYVTLVENPLGSSLGGVWPISLRGESGQLDTYSVSAHYIVADNPGKWIRVISNTATKMYEIYDQANPDWPLPKWPDGGGDYIFKLASRGRIIRDLNHPFLRFLRGK